MWECLFLWAQMGGVVLSLWVAVRMARAGRRVLQARCCWVRVRLQMKGGRDAWWRGRLPGGVRFLLARSWMAFRQWYGSDLCFLGPRAALGGWVRDLCMDGDIQPNPGPPRAPGGTCSHAGCTKPLGRAAVCRRCIRPDMCRLCCIEVGAQLGQAPCAVKAHVQAAARRRRDALAMGPEGTDAATRGPPRRPLRRWDSHCPCALSGAQGPPPALPPGSLIYLPTAAARSWPRVRFALVRHLLSCVLPAVEEAQGDDQLLVAWSRATVALASAVGVDGKNRHPVGAGALRDRNTRLAQARLERGQTAAAAKALLQPFAPRDATTALRAMRELHLGTDSVSLSDAEAEALYGVRWVDAKWAHWLDRLTPSHMRKVVMDRAVGVAAGPSGLSNDILRHALAVRRSSSEPSSLATQLSRLAQACFRLGRLPEGWADARLVALPKGKKPPTETGEYRPVAIAEALTHVILEAAQRILLPREVVRSWLHPAQHGVGVRSGVEAHALAVGVALEQEPSRSFLALDISNAFNTIARSAVLQVVQRRGLPTEFVRMVTCMYQQGKLWYEGPDGVVEIRSAAGVRQGCPLSPALFAMAFDPVLKAAAGALDLDLPSPLPRSRPPSLFGFADDIGLLTADLVKLRLSVEAVVAMMARVGLRLNWDKTQWVPPRDAPARPFMVMVHGISHEAKPTAWARYLGVPVGSSHESQRVLEEWERGMEDQVQRVTDGSLRLQDMVWLLRMCVFPRWVFPARAGMAWSFSVQRAARVLGLVLSRLGVPTCSPDRVGLPLRWGGLALCLPAQYQDAAMLAGALDASQCSSPSGRFVAHWILDVQKAVSPASLGDTRSRALHQALQWSGTDVQIDPEGDRLRVYVGGREPYLDRRPSDGMGGLQARLQALRARVRGLPEGVDWKPWTRTALAVVPFRRHRLQDVVFQQVVAAHLDVPLGVVLWPGHCPLCQAVGAGAYHWDVCPYMKGFHTQRHRALTRALVQFLQSLPAAFTVSEPWPATYAAMGWRRPDGVTSGPGLGQWAWDLTSVVVGETETVQAALTRGEGRKRAEYAAPQGFPPLFGGAVFVPLVFSNRAHLGPAFRGFLESAVRAASNSGVRDVVEEDVDVGDSSSEIEREVRTENTPSPRRDRTWAARWRFVFARVWASAQASLYQNFCSRVYAARSFAAQAPAQDLSAAGSSDDLASDAAQPSAAH